jgi:hypothetical protein
VASKTKASDTSNFDDYNATNYKPSEKSKTAS